MNIYQLPQKYFSSMIEGGSQVESPVKSNEKKESKTKQEVNSKKTTEKSQKLYDGLKPEELSDKKIQSVQSSLDKANAQVKTAENTYSDRYKSLNDLKNIKINIIKGKFATYSQEILGKLVKETLTTKKLIKLTPELTQALKKQAESDAKNKIDGMISKVNTEIQNKIVQANNTLLAFIKTRNTLSTKLDKTMLAKGKFDKDVQVAKAKKVEEKQDAAMAVARNNNLKFQNKQKLSTQYENKKQGELDKSEAHLKTIEAKFKDATRWLQQSKQARNEEMIRSSEEMLANVTKELTNSKKEVSTLKNEIAWAKKAKEIRDVNVNSNFGMPANAKDIIDKVS